MENSKMEHYYRILELSSNCTAEEIKQAYRRLAKQYHPDVNKSHDAHQKFIEISEAYEVLLHQATYSQEANQQTEYDYNAFIREVREAAQRQARMRYEKFAREHEAFRESGLYDLSLLFKYALRVLVPFFALGLISVPVVVSISEKSIAPFFYLFIAWVVGGFLLYDVFQKRKKYFQLGKFYYSYGKIKEFYTKVNTNPAEQCFYCKGRVANSHPYQINLTKVKDIKLSNRGPLQHYAGYDRKEFSYKIPRSRKAFVVHSFVSAIKLFAIILALVFAPFTSYIWRFILGCMVGWFFSAAILLMVRTASKSGYLFSMGMMIKITVWITVLSLFSTFSMDPFDIWTSEYIKLFVVLMVFADAVLEQFIKMPKQRLFTPILKKYKGMAVYFGNNYQLYLEIPVWTTIYPIVRWIF